MSVKKDVEHVMDVMSKNPTVAHGVVELREALQWSARRVHASLNALHAQGRIRQAGIEHAPPERTARYYVYRVVD